MGWCNMATKRSIIGKAVMFILIIAIITAVLTLLNWIPLIMQKQKLKAFSSSDIAAKELHIKKIYLPSYLPEHLNLAWPPTEVYGQDTPFEALVMYLSYKDRAEIGLAMHQADVKAPYHLEPRLKVRSDRSVRQIMLKGRGATLLVGVCDNNTPCNRLSWDEHGTLITLIGKFSAQDLIKIASSMIPDP